MINRNNYFEEKELEEFLESLGFLVQSTKRFEEGIGGGGGSGTYQTFYGKPSSRGGVKISIIVETNSFKNSEMFVRITTNNFWPEPSYLKSQSLYRLQGNGYNIVQKMGCFYSTLENFIFACLHTGIIDKNIWN